MPTILVVVEVFEEDKQLLLVPPQDGLDLRRFLRVRHEDLQTAISHKRHATTTSVAYLEDMKGLELDVLALIAQQVHHHLQVVLIGNEAGHDRKVGAIEQDFAEKLEGLSFGDVVVG